MTDDDRRGKPPSGADEASGDGDATPAADPAAPAAPVPVPAGAIAPAPGPSDEAPAAAAPAHAPVPDAAPVVQVAPESAIVERAGPEPDSVPRAPAPGASARRATGLAALAATLAERPEEVREVPARALAARTRRDFLLFAAGVLAAAAGAWWLLPDRARARLFPGAGHDRLDTLAARVGLTRERREAVLNRALTFDDDVAEALYSHDRSVRTYARSEARPLRNNYDGRTPGPEILAGWALHLDGLASGRTERLDAGQLASRFATHEQVTRLVCVEGWSGVAWWGGVRFADLLEAFPPAPGSRWAAIRSDVNLDGAGRPDPYYVSIDLATARHRQVLLATHHEGRPLSLAHGAPLRLLAPMKLGLKNIKAITSIAYSADEPPDYWNERGYSRYDGL